MEPFKSITQIQDIGFESQAIFVPDHFFLVGLGQDMYGGPGTERNYVSICFGSKGTRQKLKISHLSANSCMLFQNIRKTNLKIVLVNSWEKGKSFRGFPFDRFRTHVKYEHNL